MSNTVYCVACDGEHSADYTYNPTSKWWAVSSAQNAPTHWNGAHWVRTKDYAASLRGEKVSCACCVEDWAKPSTPALTLTKVPDVSDMYDAARSIVALPDVPDWAKPVDRPQVRVVISALPDDAPEPGEGWPKDGMHDAARSIVTGAKRLVPKARQAVREALDKAEAPATGREATDGAVGRALGRHGLRTGAPWV